MRSLAGVFAATTLALCTAPLAAQEAAPTLTLASVETLANQGDAEAISTVGWFYETGRDVVADNIRAASYYRNAVAKGDRFGKWRLGVMMDEGKTTGTPEQAVALFREAAADKSPGAFASLGKMYAEGRGVERDYQASMRYYQAAARLGSAHGLEGIGVLYANGQGVARSMSEALAHWMAAAAAGDSDATALLMEHMPASDAEANAAIYARASEIADMYGVGDEAQPTVTASLPR